MAPSGFKLKRKSKQIESDASEAENPEEVDDEDIKAKQKRQIYVKNLNFDTREEQLKQAFVEAKIGKVKAVTIIRKSDTQQSCGYGFVEVESKEVAEKAVKKLHNFLLDDHAIKLSLSTKAITQSEEQKKKDKVLKKRTKT